MVLICTCGILDMLFTYVIMESILSQTKLFPSGIFLVELQPFIGLSSIGYASATTGLELLVNS